MTILFGPQGTFGWFSYTTSRDTIISKGCWNKIYDQLFRFALKIFSQISCLKRELQT
ncbi:hypothetical protein ACL6MW_00030 [Pseudomonas putida]|uniref:hypothetical protein n=1 Tax=Pseudomonas putida TaxID=303 RepID=UPI0012FD5502|nr:hypothetical protein [Pseudomonas putida]